MGRCSYVWLLVLACFLNILANWFFSAPLYQLGVRIIIILQQYSNTALDAFFSAVTLLVDPVIVVIYTVLITIGCTQKRKAFNTLVFIVLNCYLGTVLKAYYVESRPFWSEKEVRNIGYYCPRQYGNPSGHSWFAPIITFVFLLQYVKNPLLRFLAVTLVVLVPLSRMYLGAHSLNQVIQGLFFGFAMTWLYLFGGLKIKITSFLSSTDHLLTKIFIVGLHLLYLIAFVAETYRDHSAHKMWASQISRKCARKTDTNHLNFMMLLMNSGLVSLTTGLAFGYTRLKEYGQFYLEGKWKFSKKKSSILFYIGIELSLLLSGLAVTPLFLLLGFGKIQVVVLINIGAMISGYFYSRYGCWCLCWIEAIEKNKTNG